MCISAIGARLLATRGSANLIYSKTVTSYVPSFRLHAESTTEVPAKKESTIAGIYCSMGISSS